MLKLLLKKQMAEIFRSYLYNVKKNKARSKGGVIGMIVLFAVLMIGVLGGMFTFLSLSMCEPLYEGGLGWLYFLIMGSIAIILGTFGSVFSTFSGLYLAKDNDLLLSMPVPVRAIITSRLLGVYLLGLMYSGVVILPAVIVYWIKGAHGVPQIVGGLLLILLISVFVLILSCALGYVVARISVKLKNKSYITTILALAFIGLYYFFYFKAQVLLQNLLNNMAVYGEKIKGSAGLLYRFGRIGEGDWTAMLIYTAVIGALGAATWIVLSRSFIKIATATGDTAKVKYREKTARLQSADQALFRKELNRFTASANYMLICGLSTLMLILGGAAVLWKGGELVPVLENILGDAEGSVAVLLCVGVCMIASMNDMVVPSISLEGKQIWVVQSLPVSGWQVLKAKLKVQLGLTLIPALFCIACVIIKLKPPVLTLILMVLFVTLYVIMMAVVDLWIGLLSPNLNWTNELYPIKQSMSVLLALLGSFALVIILGGLYLLVGVRLGGDLYMGLACVLMAVISVLILLWLRGRGAKRFANL